jgi:hypothetical protein
MLSADAIFPLKIFYMKLVESAEMEPVDYGKSILYGDVERF